MTDRPAVGEPAAPGTPEAETPRWGFRDALVGLLLAFVLSLLAGSGYVLVTGEDEVTLGVTIASLLGQWTGLAGAVVLACRSKGSGDLGRDFGLRLERRDLLPGVLAGVLSQVVLIPLLYLPFDLLGFDFDVSEEAQDVIDRASGPGLAVLALCIVIGAPLVEELFFRGLLQRSIHRRLGPAAAIGVSALLFGLTHFQPLQLLGLVAFGVVLGVLAHRAGRLGPALVAHVAFNATTVVWLVASR